MYKNPTAAEITQHYKAAVDSVTMIDEFVALSDRDDEQVDCIRRNVQHLEFIVAKDFWTTEDLTPFHAAITAGNAVLPT